MTPDDVKLLADVKAKAEAVLSQVKTATDAPGNPQMVSHLAECVVSLTTIIGRTKL